MAPKWMYCFARVFRLYALEIKSSQNIAGESLSGLKSFMEDNPGIPAYFLGADQN